MKDPTDVLPDDALITLGAPWYAAEAHKTGANSFIQEFRNFLSNTGVDHIAVEMRGDAVLTSWKDGWGGQYIERAQTTDMYTYTYPATTRDPHDIKNYIEAASRLLLTARPWYDTRGLCPAANYTCRADRLFLPWQRF